MKVGTLYHTRIYRLPNSGRPIGAISTPTSKESFSNLLTGLAHLAQSVPQFDGPTVGSRSKGDLNEIVTRLNTLKLSNVEPGQYLDGRPPGNTGCC